MTPPACGKHPQHHQDIGASSRYRARAIRIPLIIRNETASLLPVIGSSGRGRAEARAGDALKLGQGTR